MKELLSLFIGCVLVLIALTAIMAVYDFFRETPKQIKRIADKIELPIDAKPAVHGRWVGKYSSSGVCVYYRCSECGESEPRQGTTRRQAPYCPECGARMDGDT